jgi:hypothetical protein
MKGLLCHVNEVGLVPESIGNSLPGSKKRVTSSNLGSIPMNMVCI